MPKLPDVKSAVRPMPEVAGPVRAPNIAQQGQALTNFGQSLEHVGNQFAEAEFRMKSREWAVDRAKALNEFAQSAQDGLIRISSEDDLASRETLAKYGETLKQLQADFVGNHSGSPESSLMLSERLEATRAQFAYKAAAMSHQAQQANVDRLFGGVINAQSARVARDPGQLIDAIRETETALADLQDAYTPEQEQQHRDGARAQLMNSAMNTLILSGRFEEAEGILNLPETEAVFGVEGWRRVHSNILSAKVALRNEQMKAITGANSNLEMLRIMLGREPTAEERYAFVFPGLAAAKIKGGDTPSLFGKGVEGLSLNYMTQLSEAYKYGLTTPAQEKVFESSVTHYLQPRQYLNPDTGEVEWRRNSLPPAVAEAVNARGFAIPEPATPGPGIGGQGVKPPQKFREAPERETGGEQPAPKAEAGDKAEKPTGYTAWGLAKKTAGPVPFAMEMAGRTPFIGDTIPSAQYAQARNFLKPLQRDLVMTLQNNPRYSEGERKAIENDIKIEPQVFDNPTAYQSRLVAIDKALAVRQKNAFEQAQSKRIGREKREAAMNILDAVTRFRESLGVPPSIESDADYSELLKTFPPGTEFIDPEGELRTIPQ